jgi:hypothetical protein
MLSLSKQGMRDSDIQRTLGVNNVRKYLSGKKQSFVTHLRAEYDRLGPPTDGRKWLPLRVKPRGTPDRTWIQVPTQIDEISDVISVVDQLTPTQESFELMTQYGYTSREELLRDRTDHLGFFMGFMLGDGGKGLRSQERFPSMKVSAVLSKAKNNSQRFGEFTSFTSNTSLGLNMHRVKDAPVSDKRFSKSECFQWIAPVSPLFAWIFRVMMGYRAGELTTYDPMRANWLLEAPRSFKVHFLQGLAESDGWVNAGADKVIIVATPNETLLDGLLRTLDIIPRQDEQKVNILLFGTEDGLKLPAFNPRLHSNYYDDLVTMATAKRFLERQPLPDWFIEQIRPILLLNTVYSKACLEIARSTGYKISSETVKKYMTHAKA